MTERKGCSREELYDLVWSEPMTKVSERFDVSGSYLARVCSALNVPRPARGHWAKLAHGKTTTRPGLPEARPGDPMSWAAGDQLAIAAAPAGPLRTTPPSRVRVAKDAVHDILRGAKTHFENGRPVDEGAYLRRLKRLLPDLSSSGAALDAVMALANGLFNALEARGHRVVIAPTDARLRREAIDEREAPGAKR